MIDKNKVKIGDHCWALIEEALWIVAKDEDGYVTFGYESGFREDSIEIVSIIKPPRKYKNITATGV